MDLEDLYIDHYLGTLNKEKRLNEFEPITLGVAAAVGTIYTISQVIQFLMAASTFRKSIKVSPELSKRINEILKSGNKWVVHIFPDPTPNAFAIGGRNVFITEGLMDILTDQEQDAVLLHEINHNKDMHTWKNIAAESSFLYLTAFVASTMIFSGVVWPLAVIVFFIMKSSIRLIYMRFAGRYQEIKSDEFAIKHGYGDELISALKKIDQWVKRGRSKVVCGRFCQLERKISEEIDEHPSTKKRIETILRKSKELDRSMIGGFRSLKNFVSGVFKNG